MVFTLVFAVQLLASALCVIPSVQAAEAIETNHCHETMRHEMPMQAQPESSPTSVCSHCSSPENFALFIHDLDTSPTDLLLAFVVLETPVTTSASIPLNFIERAQAPPRSSTTLYNTTQRIRI